MIGQKVGNYVVRASLGKGGMGEVFLAEHPQIGRKVAIKLLDSALGGDGAAARRFLAEARSATAIAHPNVVEIYDFGQTDDGQLYYVMEALKGRELGVVMEERGAMSAVQALPYLEALGAALSAAHARGVVHRDLKPGNIFVLDAADGPLLKVLDFGIAKLLSAAGDGESTAPGVVLGSPSHMAPEQAAGMAHLVGPRTDLYALGVVLYSLLAGRPPFASEDPAALMAQQISREPPPLERPPDEVPPEIDRLVMRCLEKDPADRPASAADLTRDFAAALGQEVSVTLEAWPPSPAAAGAGSDDPTPPMAAMARREDTTLGEASGEIALALGSRWRSPRRLAVAVLLLAALGGLGVLLLNSGAPPTSEPPVAADQPAAVGRPPAAPVAALSPDASATTPDLGDMAEGIDRPGKGVAPAGSVSPGAKKKSRRGPGKLERRVPLPAPVEDPGADPPTPPPAAPDAAAPVNHKLGEGLSSEY